MQKTSEQNIKISVIVSVYGVERFIKKCISSYINQTTLESSELLIINDCTKDKSIEIINSILEEVNVKIKSKIKVINHDMEVFNLLFESSIIFSISFMISPLLR